jgi:uncharacterized protein Smg (DUF494 family)
MTESMSTGRVLRALRLLADQLESYLEGDELAFETLGERFEEAGLGGDELHSALLVLRNLSGEPQGAWPEAATAPGRSAQRVLSPEERATLSPEAWGFLLALRGRGSLDAAQFERVLDRLSGIGVRPVDVELAREVASRVALQVDDEAGLPAIPAVDLERAH